MKGCWIMPGANCGKRKLCGVFWYIFYFGCYCWSWYLANSQIICFIFYNFFKVYFSIIQLIKEEKNFGDKAVVGQICFGMGFFVHTYTHTHKHTHFFLNVIGMGNKETIGGRALFSFPEGIAWEIYMAVALRKCLPIGANKNLSLNLFAKFRAR